MLGYNRAMILHRIAALGRPLFRAYATATRGLTLGVRGLVTNPAGEVLLVLHTYRPGWYMPGGGVEFGETAEQALGRELIEEAGVRLTARPTLVSMHSNHERFRGDHVLIYRATEWEPCEATSRGEIAKVEWFAPDALPEDITPSTRRRIEEVLGGAEADASW
jgi:ADP-ribose pyrophosphatase YjhB (NUDIX family)